MQISILSYIRFHAAIVSEILNVMKNGGEMSLPFCRMII